MNKLSNINLVKKEDFKNYYLMQSEYNNLKTKLKDLNNRELYLDKKINDIVLEITSLKEVDDLYG